MKVIVHLAVEVDKDAWNDIYATGTSSREIVNDVRAYIETLVQEDHASHGGLITAVEVR